MIIINTILYLVIAFCLAGLFLIVLRKIPAIANLSKEEQTILERKKGFFQRIVEINYKHYLFNLIVVLEKTLRKLKIFSLKIENILSRCINRLRSWSQVMAHKSKEWIRHREMKRRSKKVKETVKVEEDDDVIVRIKKEKEESSDISRIPLSELKKPIQEEQKWINLIVENPKNITAYKFLGMLYWKQHNYSDAKASLEMAIRLGSKDRKVKEILEEIEKTEERKR